MPLRREIQCQVPAPEALPGRLRLSGIWRQRVIRYFPLGAYAAIARLVFPIGETRSLILPRDNRSRAHWEQSLTVTCTRWGNSGTRCASMPDMLTSLTLYAGQRSQRETLPWRICRSAYLVAGYQTPLRRSLGDILVIRPATPITVKLGGDCRFVVCFPSRKSPWLNDIELTWVASRRLSSQPVRSRLPS